MEIIKFIKIGFKKLYFYEKLIFVEVGKFWVIYMGNSMFMCIFSYFF